MNYTAYHLYLFPFEPLHFGYGGQRGNVLPTLPYIPGRALRGALAGWANKNGILPDANPEFMKIFGEMNTPGAGEYRVSFPFCYLNGMPPAPLSLFEVKGSGEHPRHGLLREETFRGVWKKKSLQDFNASGCVLDFLCRGEWPAEMVEHNLQPLKQVVVKEGKLYPAISPATQLRAAHDEDTGRVSEGSESGGLHAEEVLPRAEVKGTFHFSERFYCGDLVFDSDNEQLRNMFEALLEAGEPFREAREERCEFDWKEASRKNLVFLGRRLTPAALYAVEESEPFIPSCQEGNSRITLTFTADVKTMDGDPYPFAPALWESCAGLENAEKKRCFSARTSANGAVREKNKDFRTLKTAPALQAGSCVYLDKACLDREEKCSELAWQGLIGTGGDIRNGFGRFTVNDTMHEIETEEGA